MLFENSPLGNYYLITKAKQPYGHGLMLNVSLVSDMKDGKNSSLLNPKLVATAGFNGTTDHFLMRNTYNALSTNYPNDDILKFSVALTRSEIDSLPNVEKTDEDGSGGAKSLSKYSQDVREKDTSDYSTTEATTVISNVTTPSPQNVHGTRNNDGPVNPPQMRANQTIINSSNNTNKESRSRNDGSVATESQAQLS